MVNYLQCVFHCLIDVFNDDVKTLNFQLTPVFHITNVTEQVQELVLDSLD